jgi:inhibitor of cysteine peptidase
MEIRVLTEKENGSTVSIMTNQQLVIQLEENPSTGYQWEPPESCLTGVIVKKDFAGNAELNPGKSMTREFYFEARHSGTEKIKFKLKRAWEDKASFIKEFEIVVLIP